MLFSRQLGGYIATLKVVFRGASAHRENLSQELWYSCLIRSSNGGEAFSKRSDLTPASHV